MKTKKMNDKGIKNSERQWKKDMEGAERKKWVKLVAGERIWKNLRECTMENKKLRKNWKEIKESMNVKRKGKKSNRAIEIKKKYERTNKSRK